MTTLKEYKAMMEGATDALNAKPAFLVRGIAVMANGVGEKINQLNKASREIAPELIRVIELADDAIVQLLKSHDNQSEQWANEALSEIRKLKGE